MSRIHQFVRTSPVEALPVAPIRQINVWSVDPRWNRVEWFDDHGLSLGIVTFERRSVVRRPARRRSPAVLAHLHLALANLFVWLKESLGCRLSTN